MNLTTAQKKALKAICDGDGGVVDKCGKMVIRGERTTYDAATWLRLISHGLMFGGQGRLVASDHGRHIADETTI